MKYKVAVCDDNKADQDMVTGLIESWARAAGRVVEIHTFLSAEEFLFRYADEKDFSILVLDIEMGNMNGVELAREIRKGNQALQILFVTGFPDFMAEGYDVDAVHYLMKPLVQDRFYKAMDKAVSHLNIAEPVLLLQENGEKVRIEVSRIFYVEVFSHSCDLHTADGVISYKIPISRLEEELGKQFVRVHRSYLVNIERIKRIAKTEILLDNGDVVPLSRRKFNEVNLAFIDLFKGKLEKS